ncbi:hypothetical protein ACFVIM_20805 [Streptomyces sp. NPDC057638]|uniref:hypothetical protein n=1 Tax=Streptomyces sp. NPDC057638 TaxID=3346190 RepID=UPI0036BA7349
MRQPPRRRAVTRLWLWLTLALGSAEERLGLGFALLRLRLDAEAADDGLWFLTAEAHQQRIDAELHRLLDDSGDGAP